MSNYSLAAQELSLRVAREVTGISVLEKAVLRCIADHVVWCFDVAVADISVATICKETLASKSSVMRAITSLEDAGYLVVCRYPGEINAYSVVLEGDAHNG